MTKERLELVPDINWTVQSRDEYWFDVKSKDPERLKLIFDWCCERYDKPQAGPARTFRYYLHRILREACRWDPDGTLVDRFHDDWNIDGYHLGLMLTEQQAVELKLVFDQLFNV